MLYIKQKGNVDYTIVGTPTIVDGVASGFGNGNYITIPNKILDNFEFVLDFNTADISNQYIFSGNTNGLYVRLATYSSNNIRVRINYGSYGLWGTHSVSQNSHYKIKIICDGVTLSLYEYINGEFVLEGSTNVEALTTETVNRFGVLNTQTQPFNGSIDLNNTYIKINGQPWFGVCPVEVKKHQIMGPVGYELSGNATVTDGILTGVDISSSCGTSISLPLDFNELEFVFKARRSSWTVGSTSQILPLCGWGAGSGSTRRITTNSASGEGQGTRVFNGSSQIVNIDNSRFDVTAYTNSGYYTRLRVIKNANDYTYELGLSGDKQVWVTASANYSTNICTQKLWLLRNSSGATSSTGEMDLNETYVKVDGKIWFWQPRETERIVVNGVEVWNKNEV